MRSYYMASRRLGIDIDMEHAILHGDGNVAIVQLEKIVMGSISKDTFGPLTANAEADAGVVITFPDGARAARALDGLSSDVITRLAVHGLSQKLGDSFANASKAENPSGWAKQRVADVIAQLEAGEWRVVSEAGPTVTLLGRALARATGHTVEESMAVIRDKEESLDEDAYKAWTKAMRAGAKIRKATAEIKAEDAAKALAAAPKDTGTGEDLANLFA